MNKMILTISACIFGFSALVFGQIKITEVGQNPNLAGSIHTVTPPDGSEQIIELQVHNLSTKTQNWYINRVRVLVPANGWTDYLCWGVEGDPLGGSCYSAQLMNSPSWTTPDFASIPSNQAGLLQIHINPDDNIAGNGHYRYYVTNGTDIIDSVDIVVKRMDITGDVNGNGVIEGGEITGDINGDGTIGTGEIMGDINGDGAIGTGEMAGDSNGNGLIDNGETYLAVKKIKAPFNVSLYPNPATDYLQVNTTNSQEGTIRIVDVLGKEVLEEKLVSNKKYSVRDLKNGVYILMVTTEGNTYSKRFVVKHD